MQNKWLFPSRNLKLENEWVRLTPVDLHADLEALFNAASIEHNGEDIFMFHVNVPPMTSIDLFRQYLEKKIKTDTEVTYKVWSKRLQKFVGCASLMNVK